MEQHLFDMLTALELRAGKQTAPATERMLAYEAAKFTSVLAVSNKAQLMVEIGSGVGYATLWLAYAASITGGKLLTCELDPVQAQQVQSHLEGAGMTDYVEILIGDARELLRHRTAPVDFLLIDGDYGQYETYFDVVYKQMKIGATVVACRVSAAADELADYTTYVQNHPHLESVTVPLGEGLEVSVKIS
jgi:predicted O-methyltransferase YrrM